MFQSSRFHKCQFCGKVCYLKQWNQSSLRGEQKDGEGVSPGINSPRSRNKTQTLTPAPRIWRKFFFRWFLMLSKLSQSKIISSFAKNHWNLRIITNYCCILNCISFDPNNCDKKILKSFPICQNYCNPINKSFIIWL